MNCDDFALIAIKRHFIFTNKTTQLNIKVMLQGISVFLPSYKCASLITKSL